MSSMITVQQEVIGHDQTEEPEDNAPVNEGLQEVAEEPTQQQGLHRSTRRGDRQKDLGRGLCTRHVDMSTEGGSDVTS